MPSSWISAERLVQVGAGLDVHGARVGPGLREFGQLALGLLDHEMHVDRAPALVHEVGERRHDARAERDHGDEMAVHHVDVERARTGVEQLDDLAAKRAEVGREDRRDHQCPGRPAHAPSLASARPGGAPPAAASVRYADDRLPRDRPSRGRRQDRVPARRVAHARAPGRHRRRRRRRSVRRRRHGRAGDGELVLVAQGSAAREAIRTPGPIDAAIVGILDSLTVGGKRTYTR